MKIGKIEGSADELSKFFKDSHIEVSSILGGSKDFNVPTWIVITLAGVSVALLFFHSANIIEANWGKLLVNMLFLVSAAATGISSWLRWHDWVTTATIFVASVVMYVIFSNIMTPEEVIDKAEKYIPQHSINNIKESANILIIPQDWMPEGQIDRPAEGKTTYIHKNFSKPMPNLLKYNVIAR